MLPFLSAGGGAFYVVKYDEQGGISGDVILATTRQAEHM